MIATKKAAKGMCIKVFCLNLRFGLADDGPNNWEYRKKAYPALLQKYNSDFYAFQEANDFQISYLRRLLADYDFIGRRFPAPDYWQNNIIFHHRRWKCLSGKHFYLSQTPDVPSKFAESQWPRQCTLGTFQNGRFKLAVVNTHFDFKSNVQRQSALLIIKRLKHYAPGWPAVVMGDFNAGPDSSCIAAFTETKEGFRSALRPPNRGTFHEFEGWPKAIPLIGFSIAAMWKETMPK